MTPNMTRALQDAAPYGLQRHGGGWVARDAFGKPRDHAERHAKQTITALVDRSLISLWNVSTVACLTELGEQRLEAQREDRDMRKAAGQ